MSIALPVRIDMYAPAPMNPKAWPTGQMTVSGKMFSHWSTPLVTVGLAHFL
jgi:hypothetical protein